MDSPGQWLLIHLGKVFLAVLQVNEYKTIWLQGDENLWWESCLFYPTYEFSLANASPGSFEAFFLRQAPIPDVSLAGGEKLSSKRHFLGKVKRERVV